MWRRALTASVALAGLVLLTGCVLRSAPSTPSLPPILLSTADEELARGNLDRAAELYGQFVEAAGDAAEAPRARAMRSALLRLRASEAEAARLRHAHEAAEHALAAREHDVRQVRAELDARQGEDRARRTALDNVRAELDRIRAELDKIRADRDLLQAETERLRVERERLRADVERLRTIDLRDQKR